jgi:hypothetical protein
MFYSIPSLGPSIQRDLWREKGLTEFETLHLKLEQRQQRLQQPAQYSAEQPDKVPEMLIGIPRPFRPKELVASIREPIDIWLTNQESFWTSSLPSRRSIWHQTDFYWLHKHQAHLTEQVSILFYF